MTGGYGPSLWDLAAGKLGVPLEHVVLDSAQTLNEAIPSGSMRASRAWSRNARASSCSASNICNARTPRCSASRRSRRTTSTVRWRPSRASSRWLARATSTSTSGPRSSGIKYAANGDGLTLRVAVVPLDGQWRTVVEDDGPGIPTEDRERVFERGRRLTREERGLGLGLAVLRDVVIGAGGEIHVEDAALGGARFVVALPRTSSDDAAS